MSLLGIGAALGGLGSLIGGLSASKQAKKSGDLQRQIGRAELGLFRQASPYYNQALQYYANNAGIQLPPAPGNLASTLPVSAQPPAGVPNPSQPPAAGAGAGAAFFPSTQNPALAPPGGSLLPPPGLAEADRLRFLGAEEDIDRLARQRGSQLSYNLGRQGAGSNTIAAAMQRNESDAFDDLARFRRQQAINAGLEQERRVQALLGALGLGLGQGQAAAGIFGANAALSQNSANAAGAGVGDALNNYLLYRQMRKYQAPRDPGFDPRPADVDWRGDF